MNSLAFSILAVLLVSFCSGSGLSWAILRSSQRWPVLARASSNRLTIVPTPVWGGIAIFLAFLSAVVPRASRLDRGFAITAILAGSAFCLGLTDDIWKLRPRWKLMGQILCALLASFFVFDHSLTGNHWLDIPLTLLWIVGITNAFNLIDNINGLSAGTAVVVSSLQAVFFLHQNEPARALGSIALVGALLGFLIYNFPKGRIFMGDSGSLFIGFWLAVTTLLGTESPHGNHSILFLFPMLVMIVPVCDTTFVTLTRMLKGRPISVGGTDHLSHRLVAYGLSHKSAVFTLWTLSLLSGGLGILTVSYGLPRFVSIATLLLVAVTLFGIYLTRFELNVHPISSQQFVRRPLVASWVRGLMLVLFDCILITTAYYLAYLLRFDGTIDMALFTSTMTELILIKLGVLVAFGAYRPWWDYFGLRDAYRLGGVSVLATLIAIAYFSVVYRFYGFSRVVFAADFLVFTLLTLAFRFSFRLFDELSPASHRKRALIYGADGEGETVLQLVSKHYRFRVVGFLDDDRGRKGHSIHSVPVRGGIQDLGAVAKELNVQVVLLASSVREDTKTKLRTLCHNLNIPLMALRLVLEDLQSGSEVTVHPLGTVSSESALQEAIAEPALKAFSGSSLA